MSVEDYVENKSKIIFEIEKERIIKYITTGKQDDQKEEYIQLAKKYFFNKLSYNPNVPESYIEQFIKEDYWNFDYISSFVSPSLIEKYPNLHWNFSKLSSNTKIDWNFFAKHDHQNWQFDELIINPSIPLEKILETKDKYTWPLKNLLHRKSISIDYIYDLFDKLNLFVSPFDLSRRSDFVDYMMHKWGHLQELTFLEQYSWDWSQITINTPYHFIKTHPKWIWENNFIKKDIIFYNLTFYLEFTLEDIEDFTNYRKKHKYNDLQKNDYKYIDWHFIFEYPNKKWKSIKLLLDTKWEMHHTSLIPHIKGFPEYTYDKVIDTLRLFDKENVPFANMIYLFELNTICSTICLSSQSKAQFIKEYFDMKKIVRAVENASFNPKNILCQNRLKREFEKMMTK